MYWLLGIEKNRHRCYVLRQMKWREYIVSNHMTCPHKRDMLFFCCVNGRIRDRSGSHNMDDVRMNNVNNLFYSIYMPGAAQRCKFFKAKRTNALNCYVPFFSSR